MQGEFNLDSNRYLADLLFCLLYTSDTDEGNAAMIGPETYGEIV